MRLIPGLIGAAFVLTAAPGLAAEGGADPPIRLALPVACQMGRTCFIQQYFDHDPGPGAKDYRCGVMTYDGHDGVDIRVPTLADQRKGVAILAAADGVIRGVRDGMADQDVRIAGEASVRGRECGNGVVISHREGWETQYCHMARGSVAVRAGQAVTSGTPLGRIGESGDAAFAHVHVSVRRNGQKIDPFAWDAPAGACGVGQSLWSAEAAAALAYRSPDVINAGFAPGAVTLAEVESGGAEATPPTARGPALVAYVRAIGLKAGDVITLTLKAPGDAVVARTEAAPLAHDRAEQLTLVGGRTPGRGWASGRYVAVYEVRRAGAEALSKVFTVEIRQQ